MRERLSQLFSPRRRRYWGGVLALAAVSACHPATRAGSAPTSAPTAETALALLTALAHDSLEGRRTGWRGAEQAAALIAREMARLGLEPGGDSGYYQRIAGRIRRRRPSQDSVPIGGNVIGIWRGSDRSVGNEHLLVGAHYDHIGINTPVDGDSIYNGADDDASGTVAVLEIARQIVRGPRPRRTIVFAAFTGEEMGGRGSVWYLDHPALPLDAMVAQLQIEMIGRPDSLAGGTGRGWLTGYERSTMGETLAAAGIPLVADPHPEKNFFARSDNINFAVRGIVAHTLSSYNLHNDYHSPSDDVSRVDVAHMATVIDAAARAVRLLADGERPSWKPGGRPTP